MSSVTPAEPVQSGLLKNAQLPGEHVAVGRPHAQLPHPRVSLRVPTLCGVEYGAGHGMFAPPWWTHDVKPVGTSAHTCVPVHPPPKVIWPLQTSPCVAPVAGWVTDAVAPQVPPAHTSPPVHALPVATHVPADVSQQPLVHVLPEQQSAPAELPHALQLPPEQTLPFMQAPPLVTHLPEPLSQHPPVQELPAQHTLPPAPQGTHAAP